GPVTVRAHVGADGIRIELLAPTDQGREALKAMLPDLKRDLAQGGMGASLHLGTDAGEGRDGGDARRPHESPARLPASELPLPAPARTHVAVSAAGLDVLA